MRKRIFALALAIVMFLQTMTPVAGLAKGFAPKQKYMVKVGDIDMKSYPQPSLKIIQEANRRKKLQLQGRKIPGGAQLFSSPYFPGQDPDDNQKPLIFANVNAIFKTKGLDGGNFDWEGVFGKDSDGKLNKAQIVFEQMDAKTSTRTGVKFFLKVDKDGTYTWSDSEGKPTKLPLYSTDLKPYRYEVLLDEDVSEHVKLLTSRFIGTEGGYAFGKPDPVTGEIVGNINLDLTLQQIASTKFTSKWNTGVEESNRPTVEGSFLPGNETDPENYGFFKFPSNDTDKTIIRNDALDPQNPAEYSEYLARDLEKTPTVGVADPDPEATDTYTIDRDNKRISYKEKTYKYEVEYDVINGGKLTMTEILPVTFDANGGKFADFAAPDSENKIVKEVEYDGTLTKKAEDPTKDRETFKGWSLTKGGAIVTDADFANIKEAKTFYAIWHNNEITAEELTVHESYNDGTKYVNDFIPDLAKLKGQVKIKDANGDPKALTDDDTLQILDDNGNPIADADLKDKLYEKLKEQDTTEVSRDVTLKAKVNLKNGTSKEVNIPIKVIKNIYEAKTEEGKPNYVPEGYVKVTVDPTTKAKEPQKYFYYVNPAAKVVIPGKDDPKGIDNNQFVKWTIPGTPDPTEYKFPDRHQFDSDTTITAQYVSNVIPQDGQDKPGNVPGNYVLVEFKEGTNGTLAGTTKYWVNPTAGKKLSDITHPTVNAEAEWKHNGWDKADNTAITGPLEVTAKYLKKVLTTEPTENVDKYVKVEFTKGDHGTIESTETSIYWVLKDEAVTLTPPNVTTNKGYTQKIGDDAWSPKVAKSYNADTKHEAQYDYTGKDVVPAKDDGSRPDNVPDNFVKVTFVPTDSATDNINKIFWVAPNKEVTIPVKKPVGKDVPVNDTNPKAYTWEFSKWTSDEKPSRTWSEGIETGITAIFPKETTITANYDKNITDQGTVVAKEITVHESLKKSETEWVNNFIPKEEDLKKLVQVKDSDGNVKDLTQDDKVEFILGDKTQTEKYTSLDEELYDKLKEKDNPNGEPTRVETIKAKVTFKNGEVQTVAIPMKVYKNIYKADTKGDKPSYVPDGYVKVTLDPTNKAQDSQKTYYYVNPAAKVIIPGSDPTGTGDNVFSKWTVKADDADQDDQAKDYALKDRHKFEKASTITAQYVSNVVEQEDPEKKPSVPKDYIKVIVDTTDKATAGTKFEKTFWVNPNKEVTIPVTNPTGNKPDGKDYTWTFKTWQLAETNGTDFGTTIKGTFAKESRIEAKYEVKQETLTTAIKIAKDKLVPQDGPLDPRDLVTNLYKDGDPDNKGNLPPGSKVTFVDKPDLSKAGDTKVKIKVDIPGGKTTEIEVPIKVVDKVVKQEGKDKPKVPESYIQIRIVPTDKATDETKADTIYWVKPKDEVTLPITNPTGRDDNHFAKWKMKADDEGADGIKDFDATQATSFEKATTITAQYVSNVIPVNEDGSKPDTVPAKYLEVKFVPTDKATDQTEKIYWVNPDKEVAIPVANPIGKQYFTFKEWKMGADAKGAVYTPSTAQKFTEAITVITATYDEAKNIIPYDPSVSDPMVRPDGYVRVTFEVETGLKLTEQKAYYVKKNAKDADGEALTLKAIKDDATNYGYPAYKEETGYKFDKWDPADATTIADKDIVVKAKATKLPNVIPEKDANGKTNDKPEGYKEVTFVIKTGDEAKGSIGGIAKFYVNPTEYVKITPPATTANTGYEFGAWSQNTENFTNYKEDTTITGSFNELDAVIPNKNPDGTANKKPAGYKTVTFVIDPATGGKIQDGEATVYYVNPAKDVTVPQPKTLADIGYVFEKWDQDTVTTAKKYADDTTVKGNFKKHDDIIPSTDDHGNFNAKPEGYVTVTFYKGASGKSLTGQTVYYVNPKAGVTLSDIRYPSVEAMEGAIFRGWYPADKSREIKEDLAVIALFDVEKPYPVPVPTPGGNNSCDQPNKPDQPNQPKVGKGALNDTDHYQYLIGYPNGNFGPNRGMTRAEAATMFTRLLRQRPVKGNRYNAGLSDIHAGDWYANTVGYAVQRGIVSGYPDGSFKPNKPITRAEFAAIASRFDELAQGNDIAFNDLAPSHWGYNAIRSAATKGWISGYPDNTFRPEQAITRAEVTAITNRMLNRYADLYWIDAHRSEVIRFGDVKRSDWYFEPIMEATMGHDFIRDRDMKTEHWTGLNGKSFIEAR